MFLFEQKSRLQLCFVQHIILSYMKIYKHSLVGLSWES